MPVSAYTAVERGQSNTDQYKASLIDVSSKICFFKMHFLSFYEGYDQPLQFEFNKKKKK